MLMKRVLPALILVIPFTLLAVFFLDQPLALFFSAPERAAFKAGAREITDIGLAEYYFAIALFAIIATKFTQWILKKNTALVVDRLAFFHRWGVNFFGALVVSGVLVHILKNIFGRQRPHLTDNYDPFVFNPFNFHWDFHSLPSGHTQVMFTVAAMMTVAFPKFRMFFYAGAIGISFTRVMIQYHFLSDVILGAWVGYAGAHLAMLWIKKTRYNIFQL